MQMFTGYDITPHGDIYSHKRHKFLKQQTNHRGYSQTRLYEKDKSRMYVIHRLVAQMYLPNPDHLPFVNHKDGNKRNNHMNNLEWCTAQQNSDHAILHGKFRSKLIAEDVKHIRELYPTLNQSQLAANYGISRLMVHRIIHRKSWKHIP
jgi:hypothetical protein